MGNWRGLAMGTAGRLGLGIARRNRLRQPLQVFAVGMAQRLVEVLDHLLQVWRGIGGGKHFLIAFPHGHGHLALAHKGPDHAIAGLQSLGHPGEDTLEIDRRSAKARRPE